MGDTQTLTTVQFTAFDAEIAKEQPTLVLVEGIPRVRPQKEGYLEHQLGVMAEWPSLKMRGEESSEGLAT
eukprot:5591917-Amphidinium_carterae.1